jgi:hypothetical protein
MQKWRTLLVFIDTENPIIILFTILNAIFMCVNIIFAYININNTWKANYLSEKIATINAISNFSSSINNKKHFGYCSALMKSIDGEALSKFLDNEEFTITINKNNINRYNGCLDKSIQDNGKNENTKIDIDIDNVNFIHDQVFNGLNDYAIPILYWKYAIIDDDKKLIIKEILPSFDYYIRHIIINIKNIKKCGSDNARVRAEATLRQMGNVVDFFEETSTKLPTSHEYPCPIGAGG